MKELKEFLKENINPYSFLVAIVALIVLVFSWNMVASISYKKAQKHQLEKLEARGYVNIDEAKEVYKTLLEKRKEGIKKLNAKEQQYYFNSLPFYSELLQEYTVLKNDAIRLAEDKKNFYDKVKKANERRKENGMELIEYNGRLSAFEMFKKSKNSILIGLVLSIFLGLIIGVPISLSKAFSQGLSWVFKLALSQSPLIFLVIGFLLFNDLYDVEQNTNKLVNVTLVIFGASFISYFTIRRNSKLNIIESSLSKYDLLGIENIFTGIRL